MSSDVAHAPAGAKPAAMRPPAPNVRVAVRIALRLACVAVGMALASGTAACEAPLDAEEIPASTPSVVNEPSCEDAHSEAACMAIKGCGWDGPRSITPNTCFAIDIEPQPGTGDPGGGGSLVGRVLTRPNRAVLVPTLVLPRPRR